MAQSPPFTGQGEPASLRLAAATPQLSIVIPAVSSAEDLEQTLVSVLENRPDDCEIVVALGCEYDDPWNIRDEVHFVRAPAGASVVGCINLGISACCGEIIHVLAAGWRATAGWTAAAVGHFEEPDVAAVAPLTLCKDDHGRVGSCGVVATAGGRRIVRRPRRDARRVEEAAEVLAGDTDSVVDVGRLAAFGPTIEAGFWRAEVLTDAGPGFAGCCGPLLADADLAVAIERAGYRCVAEPASRVIEAAGVVSRSSFLEGLYAGRLFWRSVAGQPLLWIMLLHLGEIVRHTFARPPLGWVPAVAGRLVAALQIGSYLTRYRQLRSLTRKSSAADDGVSLRIDDGHPPLRPPRQRSRGSLRKSA